MALRGESELENMARLLAEENIMVLRGNYTTASFDVSSRILRIPYYSEDTDLSVAEYMNAHECAHAKFTPIEWIDSIMIPSATSDGKRGIDGFKKNTLNILEDIRIERLILQMYPGFYSHFLRGAKVLFDDGFFGTTSWDTINSYGFLDRLNIHSKMRDHSRVIFDETEYEMIRKCNWAETFDDILRLYDDVCDFLNSKKKDEEETSKTEGGESIDVGDQQEQDAMSDDGDEDTAESRESDSDDAEEELSGITETPEMSTQETEDAAFQSELQNEEESNDEVPAADGSGVAAPEQASVVDSNEQPNTVDSMEEYKREELSASEKDEIESIHELFPKNSMNPNDVLQDNVVHVNDIRSDVEMLNAFVKERDTYTFILS